MFCLFSIQQHVSWSLGITRLICNLSFEPVLPSDFQLILSLLFIKTSAFPPSVIFVGMRDAAAEERQMSSWSSNRLCSLCSLGGGAAVVERVPLSACSAESLYRGTECEMGFSWIPVRKSFFLWEAISAKPLITTLITMRCFMTLPFTAITTYLFTAILNPCYRMYFVSSIIYLLLQLIYWSPLTIKWYS